MLVSDKSRRMVTVILIDASQFEGAIAKCCDACLNGDDSTSRRKGTIVERHIETEWAKREDIENRFLPNCRWRPRRCEYEKHNPKA